MNPFLRLFSIETLITAVVTYLATTVRNPNSAKARSIRSIVHRLYLAAKHFLESTGGIPGEF